MHYLSLFFCSPHFCIHIYVHTYIYTHMRLMCGNGFLFHTMYPFSATLLDISYTFTGSSFTHLTFNSRLFISIFFQLLFRYILKFLFVSNIWNHVYSRNESLSYNSTALKCINTSRNFKINSSFHSLSFKSYLTHFPPRRYRLFFLSTLYGIKIVYASQIP